jgi:DNA repair exonuclease SbcCD nuclease subunit
MIFLHTADWHLGKSYAAFPPKVKETLQDARFSALRRMFEYAEREGIPYILSAGDQLDGGGVKGLEALQRMLALIRRFPAVRVFALGGNHDPVSPYSVYGHIDERDIPENFSLIHGNEVLEPEEGFCIYAASLDAKHGRDNPFASFFAGISGKEEDSLRVGLAHGSLMVPQRYKDDDFPLALDTARRCGLDYLALGHWHSRYIHDKRTAYPGTHEKMAFDDVSGFLRVEISRSKEEVKVSPVELPSDLHWLKEEKELDENTLASTIESLLQPGSEPFVKGAEGGEFGKPSERLLRRISFSGSLSPDELKRFESVLAQAVHNHLHLETSLTITPKPTREDLDELSSYGYLSEIAASLMEGKMRVAEAEVETDLLIEEQEVRDEALKILFSLLKEDEQ